jgi:hypothetical protein
MGSLWCLTPRFLDLLKELVELKGHLKARIWHCCELAVKELVKMQVHKRKMIVGIVCIELSGRGSASNVHTPRDRRSMLGKGSM